MSVPEVNYTQTPNIIFDSLPDLHPSEAVLAFFICRQTFGYHKEQAQLSLSFIEKGTGLSRQGVINAAEALIRKGWVAKKASGQSFTYELLVKPVRPNQLVNSVDQSHSELVNSVDRTSRLSRPELVNSVDYQLVNSVDTNKERITKERSLKKDLKEINKDSCPTGVERVLVEDSFFSDPGGLCHEDIQQTIPLESQSTIEEKEKNPPAPRASSAAERKKETEFTEEAFEEFWKNEVPVKEMKKTSRKKFLAMTGMSLEVFTKSYQAAKAREEGKQSRKSPGKPTDWQFLPRLATLINGEFWQDETIADFLPSTEEAPVAVPSQPKPEYEEWVRLAILNGQIKDYRDGKIQTNRDLWKPLEQQYNSPNLAYLRTLEAARLEDLEAAS